MKRLLCKSDFVVTEVRGIRIFEETNVTYGLGFIEDGVLMALAFQIEGGYEPVLILGITPDLDKLFKDVLHRISLGMVPVIAQIPESDTISVRIYDPVNDEQAEC